MRPVHHVLVRLDAVLSDAATTQKRELQAKQLVIGKPATRVVRGVHAGGIVDLAQGAGLGHEVVGGHKVGRHGVHHVARIGQRRRDDAAHPRGRDALTQGMDRQHARVRAALPLRGQNLMERGLELPKATIERDLSRERDSIAHMDLVREPGFAEERGREHARVVMDVHLDDDHFGPGTLGSHGVNGAHHRDVLPHVGLSDRHRVREV